MFKYILINGSRIELVKNVIKASDELMMIIEEHETLDKVFIHTITQILLFMAKIVHSLPEFLLTNNGNNVLKHELASSYSKVLNNWTNYNDNKEKFIESWIEFIFWWEEYCMTADLFLNEKDSIFISIN